MFLRENEIGTRVAARLEPGWEILDVGSGTGRLARWLADRRGVRPTLTDVVEFGNRVDGMPFVRMEDPLSLPFPDDAFDAVILLFVLHHIPRWEDQERLLEEVRRVARTRVVLIEDTPTSRVDRAFNVAWDWLLNRPHGVPTPFTFRSAEGWTSTFRRLGLQVVHRETYRARWPTLMTYHHTLFALEPAG